ncbi:hypothetical protein, partial [Xanthomonas euvesicatoria]|uniref:hypothetical protein n=1 Tax=Xanthomonas euvesicatoria TaxID=456327 RepID=UPI001BAF7280
PLRAVGLQLLTSAQRIGGAPPARCDGNANSTACLRPPRAQDTCFSCLERQTASGSVCKLHAQNAWKRPQPSLEGAKTFDARRIAR